MATSPCPGETAGFCRCLSQVSIRFREASRVVWLSRPVRRPLWPEVLLRRFLVALAVVDDLSLTVSFEGNFPEQQEHVEMGDVFRQAAVPSHTVNLDPSNPRQARQDLSCLS